MKHIKLNYLAGVALASGLLLSLSPIIVLAKDGVSDSNTTNTTVTPHASDDVSHKTTTTSENHQTEDPKTEAETEVEQNNKTHAREMLDQMGQEHKGKHTAEERQKNCDAAKAGLQKKLQNLVDNATKHQAKIDSIFSKALTFKTTHNLNPAGIDDLISAAQAAQTQSTASVNALKSLNVSLDCTSTTVAQDVATFKTAAKQARTDLLAYRKTVKAVLVALKQAAGDGSN